MTTEPIQLPDGQLFSVSNRIILAETVEAYSIAGFSFQSPKRQMMVNLTIAGRQNKTDEPADVTVFISPELTLVLLRVLVHNYDKIEAFEKANPDA